MASTQCLCTWAIFLFMSIFKRNIKYPFILDTHPELPVDPDVVQPGVYRWPPHFTPAFLLAVFIGGCLGTAARYWVSLQFPASVSGWPIATFIVNLLGAFILGFLLEGLARLGPDDGVRRIARLSIGTGFMGGFTTYSTMSVDINILLRGSHVALAAWYAGTSLAGGIICSAIGIGLAATHHKRQEDVQ